MEEHILDLTKRHFSYSRYGLTLVGTWYRVDQAWRPCFAVFLNHAQRLRPAIIPLEHAWQWSDLIGEPQIRAAHVLGQLGVDPSNADNRNKLISLVNSRMQELVEMPPRPRDAEHHADPVAELTLNSELHGKIEVSL